MDTKPTFAKLSSISLSVKGIFVTQRVYTKAPCCWSLATDTEPRQGIHLLSIVIVKLVIVQSAVERRRSWGDEIDHETITFWMQPSWCFCYHIFSTGSRLQELCRHFQHWPREVVSEASCSSVLCADMYVRWWQRSNFSRFNWPRASSRNNQKHPLSLEIDNRILKIVCREIEDSCYKYHGPQFQSVLLASIISERPWVKTRWAGLSDLWRFFFLVVLTVFKVGVILTAGEIASRASAEVFHVCAGSTRELGDLHDAYNHIDHEKSNTEKYLPTLEELGLLSKLRSLWYCWMCISIPLRSIQQNNILTHMKKVFMCWVEFPIPPVWLRIYCRPTHHVQLVK